MAAGKLRHAFDACLILKSLICNISVFKKYQVQRISAKFITFTNPEDLISKILKNFLKVSNRQLNCAIALNLICVPYFLFLGSIGKL